MSLAVGQRLYVVVGVEIVTRHFSSNHGQELRYRFILFVLSLARIWPTSSLQVRGKRETRSDGVPSMLQGTQNIDAEKLAEERRGSRLLRCAELRPPSGLRVRRSGEHRL